MLTRISMLGPLSGGHRSDSWILSKNDPSWTRSDLSDSQSLGLTSRRLCDSALAEEALVALCIDCETALVGVYLLLPPQPSAASFLLRHLLLDAPSLWSSSCAFSWESVPLLLGRAYPSVPTALFLSWKMTAATMTLKMMAILKCKCGKSFSTQSNRL